MDEYVDGHDMEPKGCSESQLIAPIDSVWFANSIDRDNIAQFV